MCSLGKQIIIWTTPLFLLGCVRQPETHAVEVLDSVSVTMTTTDSLVVMTDTILKMYEEKKYKEKCRMDSLENALKQMKLTRTAIKRTEEVMIKKVYQDTVIIEIDSTFKK